MNGSVVGKHRGYPFYTIGQRKGLGLSAGEPLYVTGIDQRDNRIDLGREADLYSQGLIARDVNMIKFADCRTSRRLQAKIRYKDEGGAATVEEMEDGRVRVSFDAKRRAITPGQSVVFYDGDDVVGGGVIEQVF